MLGRSANGIYWMTRYLERAENTARLLDVGFRMALTRGATGGERGMALGADHDRPGPRRLQATLRLRLFRAAGVQLHPARTGQSAPACCTCSRTRAATRGWCAPALTRDAWETTNEAWMVLRDMLARPVRESNLGEVISAIRRQTTQVRGAMEGTMLRNEIFNFARIGTFIERADNTARILDVKYYVLLPSVSWVGSSLDNAQWETVLRSVAGDRCLSLAQRRPARAARHRRIPDPRRPLPAQPGLLLRQAGQQPGRTGAPIRQREQRARTLARFARNKLAGRVDRARSFEGGLHEFITDFIAGTNKIDNAIAANTGSSSGPQKPQNASTSSVTPRAMVTVSRSSGHRTDLQRLAADAQGLARPVGDRLGDGLRRRPARRSSMTITTATARRWCRSSRAPPRSP